MGDGEVAAGRDRACQPGHDPVRIVGVGYPRISKPAWSGSDADGPVLRVGGAGSQDILPHAFPAQQTIRTSRSIVHRIAQALIALIPAAIGRSA